MSGWLIVSASIVDSLVPLSIAVVGVRFFAVTRAVTRYLERLSGHDAALRQLATTRSDMVRRLIPLSPAGLGATDRGQVLAALVDDVENLQNLPLRVVQPLAVSGVVALGAVGFLAFVSPPAALTLAVCLLVAAFAAVGLGWIFGSRAEAAVSARRAEVSAALVDYFGSLDVLLAFGAEAQARERIRVADAALRRVVSRASLAQAVAAGVVSLMAGAASVWALAVAAPGLDTGAIDAPWLAVAVLVPMVVFEVFGAVPIAAASWRSVRASAERIVDVLPERMPPELRPDAGQDAEVAGVPALVLRGATAHWPGGAAALTGVALDLAPGERVLVSGASGAGKSSLAAALVGFLRVDGEYRIGDLDAAALSGPALRRIVGLCEQQPQLFDEDVRQNLLFARDTATDDELLAVLDRVGLAAWVRERGVSTPGWATAVRWCPAVRRSGSPWLARCSAASRCSCWTSRRRASTPRPRTPCCATCCGRRGAVGAAHLARGAARGDGRPGRADRGRPDGLSLSRRGSCRRAAPSRCPAPRTRDGAPRSVGASRPGPRR